MQQRFPDNLMRDLERVGNELPEDVFVGRVNRMGPRRPHYAVVRYLLDTHPETVKILGKDSGEDAAGNN